MHSRKQVIELVRGEKFETLIAEVKRSYGLHARLGTRLANIRAFRSPTRMLFIWGRGGGARLHICRIAQRRSETRSADAGTHARGALYGQQSLQEPVCSVSSSDIAVNQLNRNTASMNPITEPNTRPAMKYITEPHALVSVESTPLASEPMLLPNTR
jgi:hypothetical protein